MGGVLEDRWKVPGDRWKVPGDTWWSSGRHVEGFLEESRKGRGLLGDEAVDDFAGLVGGGVWGGVEAGEARGADCEAAEAVV